MKIQTGFFIEEDYNNEILKRAEKQGRSKNYIVNEIFRKEFKKG